VRQGAWFDDLNHRINPSPLPGVRPLVCH
jgi:hypothetical protein